MARIEDLPLDDRPLDPNVEGDPRQTDWYHFTTQIDELLGSGLAEWAEETLDGIHATVTRTRRVTPAQERAVRNIEAAAQKRLAQASRSSSRRWQGFGGRLR